MNRKNTEKVTRKMKFFLKGIGFQWDGDGVFIQAEALGAEQRALWGGRKRPGTGRRRWYGMPRQGTRGGAIASRGRKEGEGMVAAVLLFSAALSKRSLAFSLDTGQVFYGSNGVNGSNGAGWGNEMAKV